MQDEKSSYLEKNFSRKVC